MNKQETLTAERRRKTILSLVLAAICIIYVLPVLTVVLNSFKLNTFVKTDTFAIPKGEMWAGTDNFTKGMTFGNYPFWQSAFYSLLITVASTALILLFTSMAAWYIARVDSKFCRAVYYLCVFSMVVPFQMVMFTLSKTADKLQLNTPWTIPNVRPSITICTFLSLTNGFKLFDQNLALTGGQPFIIQPDGSTIKTTEMLALNIYNTFYSSNAASKGVAQAKAVIFFILVAGLGLAQLAFTRKKEVQQ